MPRHASPIDDEREVGELRAHGSARAHSCGARSGRRTGRNRPPRDRPEGTGRRAAKRGSTPLGTTRILPASAPNSRRVGPPRRANSGRMASAKSSSSRRHPGSLGQAPRGPLGQGEAGRPRLGASAPRARGSNQQIGESTTGTPSRPGDPRQLQPLARHAVEVQQPRVLDPVGPRRERPDRDAERFEMSRGLDELVLAAARGLEREARRVDEHRARRRGLAGVGRDPGIGGPSDRDHRPRPAALARADRNRRSRASSGDREAVLRQVVHGRDGLPIEGLAEHRLQPARGADDHAQQATTKDQLIGTWRVLTLKATTGDKVSYPLGQQPAGYVSITPTRLWLMFINSTRKAPAAPALTDAEAIALMKSHVAWTGQYITADQTPDGIKVMAHVDTASSQAITGTDRVYFMRVEGNKLVVKSPRGDRSNDRYDKHC